jgi:hypothetical protein
MIVIDLGSAIVTYTILIALAIMGWARGFRYMLSIAIFITIGYLLTVQGGNFIVGLVNRFYTNGPKLAAFALGRDPASVDSLPPLIPDNFQAPLLLRVLVFFALLAVGVAYAWPWEGKPMSGFQGNRPVRVLGALTGLYIGVLGISALSTFWIETGGNLNLPDLIVAALNGLPNYSPIVPSVIAAFFILLAAVILLRFNRIWKT